MVNQEEIRVKSKKVMKELKQALKENNINLWLETIESEDDLVLQAQSQWFQAYRMEHQPDKVQFDILSEIQSEQNIDYECKISLEYSSFRPIVEYYRYTIQYVEKIKKCKITWIERLKQPYEAPGIKKHDDIFLFPVQKKNVKENWWDNKTFLRYAKEESAKDMAAIFARAIPRTIRFREGHPFIECASLLVNMMSEHVARWAFLIYDEDNMQTLANLHNTMSNRMLVRLTREDRDNTWSSKYVVPWYGIDELVWLRESEEYISGNCPVILGIYYAILKLCGGEKMDIWQLRMDNHEAIMANIDEKTYFLTSDELKVMDEQLLYYGKNISKIYNDKWIWTTQGMTNMTSIFRDKLMKELEQTQSQFSFSKTVKRQIGENMDENSYKMPTVNEFETSKQLARAMKNYVFQKSVEYPDSPYTWAKYAYQSLYVQKPEAYLIWSMQSQIVEVFTQEVVNIEELENRMGSYADRSIFEEDDRLMTADQVIQRKTGDNKAKAMLYYVFKQLKEGVNGYVLITDKESYYVEIEEDTLSFISMKDYKHYLGFLGNILLAMNHKRSYFPLISDRNDEIMLKLINYRKDD